MIDAQYLATGKGFERGGGCEQDGQQQDCGTIKFNTHGVHLWVTAPIFDRKMSN